MQQTPSGNKAEIKNVDKNAGRELVDMVRDRINKQAPSSMPATAPVPAAAAMPAQRQSDEIFDQLRKLGELRDAGILTEEEFSAKKAELLQRL